MERTSIQIRVITLAEKFNITMADTDRIVKGYIQFIKDSVKQGRQVDICGLALVYPKDIEVSERFTLSYDLKCLAEQLKLPQYTVSMIVKEYISELVDELLSGQSIEIRGILTMKPIMRGDEIISIRSKTSKSIREYCMQSGIYAKVKVHSMLRNKVERGEANDRKDA